jgi:hypothetical protein
MKVNYDEDHQAVTSKAYAMESSNPLPHICILSNFVLFLLMDF